MEQKQRCSWVNTNNPLYIQYHDNEWGQPMHDDNRLLEQFILETFQAGLSWECILNKREAFRLAFDDFQLDKILTYDDRKIESLMQFPGIVHNRAKLKAAITNTRIFQSIQNEFTSFDSYLASFCTSSPIYDHTSTTSHVSDIISADLRRRGMKFVGSTTIHAFLQSIGIIHSHQPDCFLYHQPSYIADH